MKGIIKVISILGFVAIIIWYLFIFLSPRDYKKPSKEFYVNDYAGFFSSASKDYLINDASYWFNYTEENSDLGGFQAVVLTYLIENDEDMALYDKTEIYRDWGIGENDMGLLILCFFKENDDLSLSLAGFEMEIGYRAEMYLTPITQRTIYDNVMDSHYNMEVVLVNLYYDYTGEILDKAYNISSSPFDQDEYEDMLINYDGKAYGESVPIDNLTYLFTKNSTFFDKFKPVIIVLVFFFTGGIITIFAGKGGRSGGIGLKRRH
ncbi:MAG: TPM domain-containing protein [Bacillales bacterium]|nr:TPM domain-containing protein [Bacillales bacterium]